MVTPTTSKLQRYQIVGRHANRRFRARVWFTFPRGMRVTPSNIRRAQRVGVFVPDLARLILSWEDQHEFAARTKGIHDRFQKEVEDAGRKHLFKEVNYEPTKSDREEYDKVLDLIRKEYGTELAKVLVAMIEP